MPSGKSKSVSFDALLSASPRASTAARATSQKSNTRCELALRKALTALGLRYRLHGTDLPGVPDIVIPRGKVTVFCDGDFWHGRNLDARIAKLSRGHNAPYWVAKIQRNVERDLERTAELKWSGWMVIRLWETDILRDPDMQARRVAAKLKVRRRTADRKAASKATKKRAK
jgi:DNA mismatch endonuclease (patch repair protein)